MTMRTAPRIMGAVAPFGREERRLPLMLVATFTLLRPTAASMLKMVGTIMGTRY